MKKIIIISAFFLSSCAYNKFLYTNENGQAVYEVNCSMSSFGDCLKEAGKQCPFGFSIMMTSEQQTGTYTDVQGYGNSYTSASASAYGFGSAATAFGNAHTNSSFGAQGMNTNLYSRYMIYTCK